MSSKGSSATPNDADPGHAGGALERTTGRFASFAVAFAFVSIATGIFTTYGSVLASSGPMGIWTWPIAVVGQLAVALVLGSLAARIPLTGYSYQWMSRLANPILGWIIGWASFSFLVIAVVAVNYTTASAILPALLGFEGTAVTSFWITVGILIVQAALIAASTVWTERVNNFAVTLELVGMVLLVVLLLVVGYFTGKLDLGSVFSLGGIPAEGYWSLGDLTSVGPWLLGFLLGAFTIVGFESAANLAEETRHPETVVPRAMSRAVIASGVLGFLFLIAVTATATNLNTLAESSTPIADVIRDVLGSWVGTVLLVFVVIAIFACGLVIVMTATRLVWAMSRDQRFPGWQSLQKISAKTNTPANATGAVVVIAVSILGVFSANTDALFILFAGATLLPALIYAGTVTLYLVKRNHLPATRGFTLGRWEIPVLVIAVIWLIFELAIFRDRIFRDPWLYVVAMFAIGGIYLGYLLVTRGVKGMAMPKMSSIDAELDRASNAP